MYVIELLLLLLLKVDFSLIRFQFLMKKLILVQ